ncbi:MAG TPA: hypothetical protein VN772_06475 [Solirubrobacteraceae bacterium]|nr:hypothetical protein [Solirubrobacteraceae bacterium]
MSAQRSQSDWPHPNGAPSPRGRDIARLRARRREARRRRRLARIDLGLGVAAAIFLLLISPGLAITGIVTLVVLLVCAASAVRERRKSTHTDVPRAPAGGGPPAPRGVPRTPRRAGERAVRDRARSTR